jgi:hypothetical protein
MRETECEMRNAKCEMRNAKCEMRNAKCEMRNAKCEMRNAKIKRERRKPSKKKCKKEKIMQNKNIPHLSILQSFGQLTQFSPKSASQLPFPHVTKNKKFKKFK